MRSDWDGCESLPSHAGLLSLPVQVYEDRAKELKEQYAQELAAYETEHGPLPKQGDGHAGGEAGGADPASTMLPQSKIKKIVKLDPEAKTVGKDAAFLITLATELFIEVLAEEASLYAQVRRGRQRERGWARDGGD